MGSKIIEILNRDESARKINEAFNKAVISQGFNKEEIEKAREIMMMICIQNNKEAMNYMATKIYNELKD